MASGGGRSREGFDLAAWVITAIDNDRRQARRDAAYQIGWYLSTRSYAPITDFHGWQREKQAIEHAYFVEKDMEAVADAVTDEMIDAFCDHRNARRLQGPALPLRGGCGYGRALFARSRAIAR
jgi:hypothetical protein